ncbi:response regulator [Actinoplanes auranticolor]|uniref:Uncharacterized protein n=1 Tax=Actinoplanes auranticolor TaxID=47988 RepID=A0A919SP47_9ACTN|nr:response regulator [Actinoplanes auranticolor]GIM74957.1 hypothetical protein Aau02nite_63560 [Actinoplanes auranticolor]
MNFIIVDDEPGMREIRQLWLTHSDDAAVDTCVAQSFEQALALGERWREFDVAVVDGYDRRGDKMRESEADQAGVPFHEYDRFPGRSVVLAAKRHNPNIIVIVTSTYIKGHDELAQQMEGAGATYVFSHDEVMHRERFTERMTDPERFAQRTTTPPPRGRRRLAEISEIVHSADPAVRRHVVEGRSSESKKASRRGVDRLVHQLRDVLNVPESATGRAVHLQNLRPTLRRMLGLDIEPPRSHTDD